MFLTVERAACEAAPAQYEYRASWLALANPEPISVEVENESAASTPEGVSGRIIGLGQRICGANTHPRHGVHVLGQIVGDDKTIGRGGLTNIIVKDGDLPEPLQVCGRTLEIAAPVDGKVSVSMTAVTEDLAVELSRESRVPGRENHGESYVEAKYTCPGRR